LSRPGLLIALSGVDCAGKTTQREQLLDTLHEWGFAPVTVWSRPGYTRGLKAAKGALRALTFRKRSARSGVSAAPSRYPRRAANLQNPLARWLWLTTALLDLLWLYGVRVRLLRARGRAVVCDRYLLDCLVDFRVNFPAQRVEQRFLGRLLRRLAARPDAAFCLLIPAEETLARARRKQRFHWETLEVLEERFQQYRSASQELGVEALDGLRPAGELVQAVRRGVASILRGAELHPGSSL
jgi:thymidylate kinase